MISVNYVLDGAVDYAKLDRSIKSLYTQVVDFSVCFYVNNRLVYDYLLNHVANDLICYVSDLDYIDMINKSIDECTDEYWCFINDRTLLYPDRLYTQRYFMQKHDRAVWAFSGFNILGGYKIEEFNGVDYFGQFINLNMKQTVATSLINSFPGQNFIHENTVLVKTDIFDKVGIFDNKLTTLYNYDMWLRLCYQSEPVILTQPLILTFNGKTVESDREKEIGIIGEKMQKYMIGDFSE